MTLRFRDFPSLDFILEQIKDPKLKELFTRVYNAYRLDVFTKGFGFELIRLGFVEFTLIIQKQAYGYIIRIKKYY